MKDKEAGLFSSHLKHGPAHLFSVYSFLLSGQLCDPDVDYPRASTALERYLQDVAST